MCIDYTLFLSFLHKKCAESLGVSNINCIFAIEINCYAIKILVFLVVNLVLVSMGIGFVVKQVLFFLCLDEQLSSHGREQFLPRQGKIASWAGKNSFLAREEWIAGEKGNVLSKGRFLFLFIGFHKKYPYLCSQN